MGFYRNERQRKEESIKNPRALDVSFDPKVIVNYKFNSIVEFKYICLKQDSVSFLHKYIVNLYISYKLDTWSKDLNTDFALGNCLFRIVKLTKNVRPDKYKYSACIIGFYLRSQFSWLDGSHGKNVINFGIDNS